MSKSMLRALALALAVGAIAGATQGAKPVTPTSFVLESPTLRLEVSPTYAYKLYEKSTGNLLLTQNATTFTIGSSSYTASSISNVSINTAGTPSLTGTLALNRTTTAQVTFSFVSADNLQVNLRTTSGTPASIAERFADTGERYYGVWENALPAALDNRGISANYDGKEVLGSTTKDVFAASARAPFYLTNKNYGIYTNTEANGTYSFAQNGNTSLKFNTPTLQYNILHGNTPKEVLAGHNTVAGPAFMPPDWAFSTIFWRDDFHSLPSQNTSIKNAQGLILDDAAKLQAAHIHAGAMWIDRPYGTGTGDSNVAGWGNMDFDASFPNPSAMAQSLQSSGINLMLWIANKANNGLKTEGSANGYLFANSGTSPGIDLRNPAAYAWFEGKLDKLDSAALLADGTTGIKGFKIDRGGEGEIPDALINAETTLLQKVAFENMKAQNGSDFFSFARNINGSGRQYAAVWSGDPKTTWLGFQTSIKNGLRSGLINFPMWGSDTGGYSGSAPSQELFSRWVAFSAVSPMMEIIQGSGRNLFYDWSPQTLAITQKFTDLHHDLIPYTRSALATALQNGTPIMRPMFLEFPTNTAVADTWDQYMYGPSLLVAPVTTPGATSRSVYLPALPGGGKWLDYNNRATVYAGGQTITAAAPLDVLPMFVREGAIIPRGDIVKANNGWTADWQPSLHIEVFPAVTQATSFDYWTGTGMTTIAVTPTGNGFDITSGDLGLPGTFEVYLTAPDAVLLNNTELLAGSGYTYDPTHRLLTVPFGLGPLTLEILGSASIFGLPSGTFAFAAAAPVPEPYSFAILFIGAAALLIRPRPHRERS
jgi:alpha-glucosidase (family GH31 glycosyl hydrolase)